MGSKKFIVISSGEVLPDFSVEQVGASLAKLYKKQSQEMIDLLISGKSKKVKSMSTRAQAKSKCAQLSSLGLRCSFSEVTKDADHESPSMYTRASYIDDSSLADTSGASEPSDELGVGEQAEHSEIFDEAIFDDVLAQAATGRKRKVILTSVLSLLLLLCIALGGYFLLSDPSNSVVPSPEIEQGSE